MQRESNGCDKYWFPSNVHVSKGFNYWYLEEGITINEEEIESDREGSGVHNKLFDMCTHTISINFIDHILKFCFCWVLSKRSHHCSQFLCGDCTISILVKQRKRFFEFCKPEE